MKACLLPAALGLLALAAPLQARDARLAARPYNASEVVRIDGRAGVQAAIAFADDELIENVAIGDSASWQVTPNKRATMLFLKPLSATARTNMTVVTDKRSYYFDLVASPRAQPLYVLRFTYPEPAGGSRHAGAQAGGGTGTAASLNRAEALALGTPPVDAAPDADPAGDLAGNIAGRPGPGAVDPAALNFAWAGKGKRQLLPARIYDDGASTYLTWTAGTAMPAILVRDAAGTEGPVNFAVREDVVVIEGVPRLLVLRSGRDTATVENRGKPRSSAPAPAAAPTLVAAAASAPQPSAPATPASPQQDN